MEHIVHILNHRGAIALFQCCHGRHVIRAVVAHPMFGGLLHVLGPCLASTAHHVRWQSEMKKRCRINGMDVRVLLG